MHLSRPVPVTHPASPGRKRRLAALTTLGLAGLLAGCGTGNSPAINATATASAKSYTAAAGNWKFTTGTTGQPAAFAGALAVSGTSVTATLHPLVTSCADSSKIVVAATGNIDASGLLTITSDKSAQVAISISGTLAPDQHSLVSPSITITGGSCATPSSHVAGLAPRETAAPTAQQFQPLTGNYSGTFTDTSGVTLTVAASLSQPTTPDANGVYHLTGSATFPDMSCLTAPVITDSTVTGDSIQATYTDQATGNTVSANGTFSSDAQTLTITNWILSGCGNDAGTGLLTRQVN